MKYLHCMTCGKEKLTPSAQTRELCLSCAAKNRTRSKEMYRKIAESNKGNIRSIKTRIKMSIAQGGDGKIEEHCYLGIKRWTRLVKERDGECVHCHSKENLEAHHLLRKSKFPQFATELWNGLTLCSPCHKITHSKVGIT